MSIDEKLQNRLQSVLEEVEVNEPGLGGAVAVARDGKIVAAAQFGESAPDQPWSSEYAGVSWSVSKGVCAIVIAKLVEDGFDVDRPISEVWPEFAANGKADITLADVMSHQSGIPWFNDNEFSPDFGVPGSFGQSIDISSALANVKPISKYKGKMAYHALTYGWIVGEIVKRLKGKSLSNYFLDELCRPLNLNMGFNRNSMLENIKLTKPSTPVSGAQNVADIDNAFSEPDNAVRRALLVPIGMKFKDVLAVTESSEFLGSETPAISLISSANSLAKLYSHFASGHIVSPSIRDFFIQERHYGHDLMTDGPRRMALGFALNAEPSMIFNSSPTVFGHPGLGGSQAFGDVEGHLGFAYLTNAMIPSTETDSRALALAQAVSG